MDRLLELAERCEKATGPDRELDVAVCAAFGVSDNQPKLEGVLGERHCRPSDDWRRVEFRTVHEGVDHILASREPLPVTASLDAAMTLVGEAWWSVQRAPCAEGYDAEVGNDAIHHGATPALALCAASLRARATQGSTAR